MPPPSGVQVDLSWEVASGGSINNSNFDIYLVKNVVLGNNTSSSNYELVSGVLSNQEAGFETLRLDESLPDQKYYILIKYVSGNSTARVKLVISQNNDIQSGTGQVNSNQVGTNPFFGPISKSSSGFSYRKSVSAPVWYGATAD